MHSMRLAEGPAAAALCLAAGLLAACGGADAGTDAATTSPPPATVAATSTQVAVATSTVAAPATPSPVPAATNTVEPTPTVEEAPHAVPIDVGPDIRNLGENVIQPVVSAGGVFSLDPVHLAQDYGIVPPPCAAFVFYLTWQVRSPYPPEGVALELYWTRMGGSELFGEGPSGQASRGCGEIQIVNNSAFEIAVEVRFAIGEIAG